MTKEAPYLDPGHLYPIRSFYSISGIARTRVHEAKKLGIKIPTLHCGKRVFIRGADAIWFVEQLASIDSTLAGAGA